MWNWWTQIDWIKQRSSWENPASPFPHLVLSCSRHGELAPANKRLYGRRKGWKIHDGIHRSMWYSNSFICNVNWHCFLMLSHPFIPLLAGCRTKSSSVPIIRSNLQLGASYMINFPSHSTAMLLNRICGDEHHPRKPMEPWPTSHTSIFLFNWCYSM